MKAEILAVGSELLTPGRVETNAVYLTRRLLEIGIRVIARTTVEDDRTLLASAFREALARADLVIATGGLGPTEDDLTREAAAEAMGLLLERDPMVLEGLIARFARAGREMAPVNRKQADLLTGGEPLPNPRGTAPGQRIVKDGRTLILLPGPPSEMEPMFETSVWPQLRAHAGAHVIRTRVLKIAGMTESDVEQITAPVYTTFTNPRTTILSAPGQVELHLVAEGDAAAAGAAIEALAAPLREKLRDHVFSDDGRDLHVVVADRLRAGGLTLALAESCTGGLIAARLTDTAGASAFLDSAIVTYSNRAKVETLGVPAALIEKYGAVSEEVARAMAEVVRRTAGTDIGGAVTGIAGPDGGSAEKPVGLVFLALSGAAGDVVRRVQFSGSRDRVRFQASQTLLDMIRRGLPAS